MFGAKTQEDATHVSAWTAVALKSNNYNDLDGISSPSIEVSLFCSQQIAAAGANQHFQKIPRRNIY